MANNIIGLWDRFEIAVSSTKTYPDPYREVTLDVTYTRPDGSTAAFWGFYDGGTTWKLRWMPDQTGDWTFRARFSDGSPAVEGAFTCVPSDLPGMPAPDEANPVWFGYKGGGHLLVRSLHLGDAFFASNLPGERRKAFLDWAQAQGYNMLSIGSHYLNRAEPGRGSGWETPCLWPLQAGEFQKTEGILDDMAARRLLVFPFGGFFGRGSNYPCSEADQELYVRYVLARFGAYWNILLNVSGPEPLLVKEERVWIEMPELERMGRMIQALDPFDHPLTVHNKTGDDEFLGVDWLDYGTLQGPKTPDLPALYEGLMRNHHPDRPLYAQETLWSGNKYHPQYSDRELRRNAIILNMAAAAINFSDNGGADPEHQGDSSTGFSGTLNLEDCRQWRHDILKQVWDFFETLPFYELRPCPELVTGGYCLAQPGKQYLVYVPERGPVSLRLEEGAYRTEWINAQNPGERLSATATRDGALETPDAGEDWFVYLTRTH